MGNYRVIKNNIHFETTNVNTPLKIKISNTIGGRFGSDDLPFPRNAICLDDSSREFGSIRRSLPTQLESSSPKKKHKKSRGSNVGLLGSIVF